MVVLPPSVKECSDRKDNRRKTLVCVASDFYPDHVRVAWTMNDQPVTEGVASDHAALRVYEKYQITSRLRVEAKTWHTDSNFFKCTVSFYNGSTTTNHTAVVRGNSTGTLQHPE